jgi:predicted MFS family arabinose efflux permease
MPTTPLRRAIGSPDGGVWRPRWRPGRGVGAGRRAWRCLGHWPRRRTPGGPGAGEDGFVLALRNRDFRLLWTGQLLSSLGSWFLLVAIPYQVFELTGSPAATGFAFAAQGVPAFVIGPAVGVAVDRWDRRRTMLVASLGQAGCVLPLALVHRADQLAIVYLALMAESALGQFYQPAQRALIPGMLGRADELTSANALMAANNAVTRLAGASLGGVVFAVLGLSALVTIDAATYVAVAACLALLRWRAAARPAAPGRDPRGARAIVAEFGAGFRHLAACRPLWGLVIAAAAFWVGNGAFTALLVSYSRLRLHGGPGDVGFLVAATGAGYLAGAPLGRALYRHAILRVLVAASLLVTAAAYAAWFSVSNLDLALLLAAVTGMSAMVFLIARLTYLQQCTPDAVLGRVSAICLAAEALAGVAGTAVGGVLAGLVGYGWTVAAAVAAIGAGGLLAARLVTGGRRPRTRLRAVSGGTSPPAGPVRPDP